MSVTSFAATSEIVENEPVGELLQIWESVYQRCPIDMVIFNPDSDGVRISVDGYLDRPWGHIKAGEYFNPPNPITTLSGPKIERKIYAKTDPKEDNPGELRLMLLYADQW